MNEIHAHAVMEMMVETGGTHTRASLEEAIVRRFGSDARFYSCSAENMTAATLVDFLESKGKFVPVEGGFTTTRDHLCNH
jgi:probable metal-binding protein